MYYVQNRHLEAHARRNPGQGALAARSARMDFDEADEIDDDELNAILWTAIKKTTPPVPVRSYFGK
jgi:hypothetical protein